MILILFLCIWDVLLLLAKRNLQIKKNLLIYIKNKILLLFLLLGFIRKILLWKIFLFWKPCLNVIKLLLLANLELICLMMSLRLLEISNKLYGIINLNWLLNIINLLLFIVERVWNLYLNIVIN